MDIHVVRSGDTPASIARRYGVTDEQIIRDNEIEDPTRLVVGQTLVIMYPDEVYTVEPGDSLYTIATDHNVSIQNILQNNPSIIGRDIMPGEELVISYEGEKLGEMTVNGYAYPYIDRELLIRTLPYLTYISIFTYGFTPEGELLDIDDEEIIALARDFGVAPLMQVSTYSEEGRFDSELASQVLNNEEAQANLIENIMENLAAKNYYGLDIDFEYIFPEDREVFINFVERVTNRAHEEGYEVMIALAPKISADQPGLLYEAHDYRRLGEIVDWALIMTYEWGYTYGPPMAVAPYDAVREVLDYAVTDIDPEKVRLGVPNYGYNWILPFVQGESRATVVGNVGAVSLARDETVSIEFDEEARSPFFTFYDEELREHIVWFEDARSIDAKLRLVEEYGLNGVSYWTIMREFPQNWLVLISLYDIIKLV